MYVNLEMTHVLFRGKSLNFYKGKLSQTNKRERNFLNFCTPFILLVVSWFLFSYVEGGVMRRWIFFLFFWERGEMGESGGWVRERGVFFLWVMEYQ